MKDYNIKLMDLSVSNTLGCVGNWNTYLGEDVVDLDLQL